MTDSAANLARALKNELLFGASFGFYLVPQFSSCTAKVHLSGIVLGYANRSAAALALSTGLSDLTHRHPYYVYRAMHPVQSEPITPLNTLPEMAS